jgi:hypothetical protein
MEIKHSNFGKALRSQRVGVRLTQEELASYLGDFADAVSLCERGLRTPKRRMPQLLRFLRRDAKALRLYIQTNNRNGFEKRKREDSK